MDASGKVRKSAVAGTFYEASAQMLRDDITKYLTAAAKHTDADAQKANIIIAPHAGYVFSASVAASAYCRVPCDVETVFLIGPSHHLLFDGVHVTDADFYETPLGKVAVDKNIVRRLCENPHCANVTNADEKEHCLEVQLPFLQLVLNNNFKIVPLLTGNVNAGAVADILLPFAKDKTLIIASSDLSHYQPQRRAREMDEATIYSIVSGDANGFMDGCGETAMRAVMLVAQKLSLAAEVLDVRTSHDTAPQYCDDSRVVGYAAIAFVKQDATSEEAGDFSEDEKEYLLKLSRKILEESVNSKNSGAQTQVQKPEFTKLSQSYGCFVTLHAHGNLRGCIGNIEPIRPLYKSVIENTINAAFHDPRFHGVTPRELADIKIEISILTRPTPLKYGEPNELLSKLIPNVHGVILKFNSGRQSTFLPQVWEQIPNKVLFLEHLSLKAGESKDAWMTATVLTYKALHFCE